LVSARQRTAKADAQARAAAAIDKAQKEAAQLEQIAGAKDLAYELQGLLQVSLYVKYAVLRFSA